MSMQRLAMGFAIALGLAGVTASVQAGEQHLSGSFAGSIVHNPIDTNGDGMTICGGEAVFGIAEVNGTKLYYETMGEGQPLVLLHAGNFDRRIWDDQFSAFAERYQVIRYDARGHGKSSLPTKPYSDAEDLYRLLKLLHVEKAHLVGLSLGGRIILDFALAHPEMVHTLILVAPGLSGYNFSAEFAQRGVKLVQSIHNDDGAPAGELWLQDPYMASVMENPLAAQKLRPIAVENSRSWLINPLLWHDLYVVPPAIQRLSEIRAPTLIIVGDRDQPDIQHIVHTLETGITGVTKVVLPGAGHVVNMEKPEEFNHTVLEFLSKRSL